MKQLKIRHQNNPKLSESQSEIGVQTQHKSSKNAPKTASTGDPKQLQKHSKKGGC